MFAKDVHTIAKSLSPEEYIVLYNLIKEDLNLKLTKKSKKINNGFTYEEAIDYLLKNHCK